MALYLCDLPPQDLQPQSNHEKNIRYKPIEGYVTEPDQYSLKLSRSSKNKAIIKVVKKQGKFEKLSQLKGI